MSLRTRLFFVLIPLLLVIEAHAETPAGAAVGQVAPGFTLVDVNGKSHALSDFTGKVVILEWFNPDCPFVQIAHGRTQTLKGEGNKQKKKGMVWLAINSSAPGKQGHGVATNRKGIQRFGIQYPVLLDETGRVGRLYGAKRTPHMMVIDAKGTLVYRGAIDNTGGGDIEKNKPFLNWVRQALSQLKSNPKVRPAETRAWGCTVKY